MEYQERMHLIMALYEFAWRIAELECNSELNKLSKKRYNDKLTEEATKKLVARIGISPDELHNIIRKMTSQA